MEKKISKNQKMYPHRFGCSQNHPKAPQWGFLALFGDFGYSQNSGDPTKGMTRIWDHFVILDVCECVMLRPQIMLKTYINSFVDGNFAHFNPNRSIR